MATGINIKWGRGKQVGIFGEIKIKKKNGGWGRMSSRREL